MTKSPQSLPRGWHCLSAFALTALSVFHGSVAGAASQDCAVSARSGSDIGGVSLSETTFDSSGLQGGSSGSSDAQPAFTQSAQTMFASSDGAAVTLLSLLGSAPAVTETQTTLTELVLSATGPSGDTSSQSLDSSGSAGVSANSLLAGLTSSEGGVAEGGECFFGFDLESGDSGDSEITARGGDSGDAIGGDAIGGDSTAVGTSGNVAVGGNGGPGGSAGGSGAYAGAVIGDNSKGGGGDGGDGGYAVCVGGPVTGDGKSCSSGDVFVISGNGGAAAGGNARSGDGGEVGIQDTGTGSTGDNNAG